MKLRNQKRLISEMRQTQQRHRKIKRQTKLEPLKEKILILRQCNTSYANILYWLKHSHHLNISYYQLYRTVTIDWKDDPIKHKLKLLTL